MKTQNKQFLFNLKSDLETVLAEYVVLGNKKDCQDIAKCIEVIDRQLESLEMCEWMCD